MPICIHKKLFKQLVSWDLLSASRERMIMKRGAGRSRTHEGELKLSRQIRYAAQGSEVARQVGGVVGRRHGELIFISLLVVASVSVTKPVGRAGKCKFSVKIVCSLLLTGREGTLVQGSRSAVPACSKHRALGIDGVGG